MAGSLTSRPAAPPRRLQDEAEGGAQGVRGPCSCPDDPPPQAPLLLLSRLPFPAALVALRQLSTRLPPNSLAPEGAVPGARTARRYRRPDVLLTSGGTRMWLRRAPVPAAGSQGAGQQEAEAGEEGDRDEWELANEWEATFGKKV